MWKDPILKPDTWIHLVYFYFPQWHCVIFFEWYTHFLLNDICMHFLFFKPLERIFVCGNAQCCNEEQVLHTRLHPWALISSGSFSVCSSVCTVIPQVTMMVYSSHYLCLSFRSASEQMGTRSNSNHQRLQKSLRYFLRFVDDPLLIMICVIFIWFFSIML